MWAQVALPEWSGIKAQGRTPFDCVAATYNDNDGICLLHGSGNDFEANSHLVPDMLNNHYEKGCIQSECWVVAC